MPQFLDHPFILVGAIVLAVFGIFRLVISSGVLKPTARRDTAPILHKVLNYGFVLGLAVVVLGFGLSALRVQKETSRGKQAKLLLAAEITQNIRSLDERLGYFQISLDQPIQNEQLDKIREKHLPSMSTALSDSYTRLMNDQRITTLRQMLNSSPLQKEGGMSAIDNLVRGNVNAEQYQGFYKSIAETEGATESLLNSLSLLSSPSAGSSKEWAGYANDQVKVAAENLEIESHFAYIAALRVFQILPDPPYPVEIPAGTLETLRNLTNLKPPELPTPAAINDLSTVLLARKVDLLARKSELLERAKRLTEAKFDQYENIDELFKINPSDTWDQVIGKAVSLREFGRTSDAVAAFSRYADMFSAGDPGARDYSHRAQAFTIQQEVHGMKGGIYVYQVEPGGVADRAGIRVGDIIVSYDGQDTADMPTFVNATKSALKNSSVEVRWLRLQQRGQFESLAALVQGGTIGISTMPI